MWYIFLLNSYPGGPIWAVGLGAGSAARSAPSPMVNTPLLTRWVICLCNHYRWEAVRLPGLYESVQSVVEPHHSRTPSRGIPAVQLPAVWPHVPPQVWRTTTHRTRSFEHLQTMWLQADHHWSIVGRLSCTAAASTSSLLTAVDAGSLGFPPGSAHGHRWWRHQFTSGAS